MTNQKYEAPMKERVNIPVPDGLKADLKAMQKDTNIPTSALARQLLEDAVAKWKKSRKSK